MPCVNCDPRTKLYIAEIDPATCRIRKDTLTIVEQQDKKAGQPSHNIGKMALDEFVEHYGIVLRVTDLAARDDRSNRFWDRL